jgi:DNA-binding transcriptional MerR regulator
MNESNPPSASTYTIAIVAVEGGRTYSLEEAARLSGLHPDMLQHYCRIGLLGRGYARENREPIFNDNSLYELRRIEHARVLHGLNRNALPLLCELWREVDELRAEVRFLREQ